jgi:integrase
LSWEEKKKDILRSIGARRDRGTLKNYRVAVEKFEEYWKKEKREPIPDPEYINVRDLEDYLIYMKSKEGLKTNTIIKRLGNLIRFLGRARNPNLAYFYDLIPRREEPPKEYYTKEELKILLNLYGETSIYELMHRVYIWALVFTGARKSEIQNLRWDDILWDKNKIIVKGKFKKVRTIYLDPRLRKLLAKYKKAHEAFMKYRLSLGQNITDRLFFIIKRDKIVEPKENSFFITIKKRAEKMGIKHFNIKKFRSTYVKIMHDAKIPTEWVARQLGHSSTRITRKYYHDFDVDILEEAHKKVEFFKEIEEEEK